MGFFKNLFKRKKDTQQEQNITVSTNPKHNRDYQGVTRPTANINSVSNTSSKKLQSNDIYTGQDVWQIASNAQIIREKQNITQKELAEKLGYKSASFVSRLELWELEKITKEQVESIATALDVPTSELLKITLTRK